MTKKVIKNIIHKEFVDKGVEPKDLENDFGWRQEYCSRVVSGKQKLGPGRAKDVYKRYGVNLIVLLYGDESSEVIELLLKSKTESNYIPDMNKHESRPEDLKKIIEGLEKNVKLLEKENERLSQELDKSPKKNQDFIND